MHRSILGRCPLRGRCLSRVRIPARLVLAASTGLLTAMMAATPALAQPEDSLARPPAGSMSRTGELDANAAAPDRAKRPRTSGVLRLGNSLGGARWTGTDSGWSGAACIGLVLAICGGVAVAARRLGPRGAAEAVQVVGRVTLSPKHTVYLLRIGRRVLVVGAGPQGPPALITELDDVPQGQPAPQQGDES